MGSERGRALGRLAACIIACAVALASCGGGGSGASSSSSSSSGNGGSTSGTTGAQAGAFAWSSASATWPEMGAAAVATVTRSGGSDGTVTVAYSTHDGSAVAGRDYTAASGTLTWPKGDTQPRTVTVLLGSAAKAPAPVDLTLSLSNPTGGASVASADMKLSLDHVWKVPATLPQFDLSKWRLDLPVDANGGTGGAGNVQFPADAILPSELSTTFVGPYFYGDAQGSIVFAAPANGAVTTPGSGSDHTRSELHEVYTGPGADANGDWTSGKGVLTSTCSVQSVAPTSDVAIIGQLRSPKNNLALLLYRPAHRDVALDLYAANASGSPHTRTPVVENVNLGDPITYSLGLQGGVLTATVDGSTQTFATGSAWSGVPLYFKLGAYHTARNTGNAPNDLTMVTFSAFSVTH